MFGTKGEESVFLFSMSNRLSDRDPCRGVLNTPLARLSSTLSPLAGRLVGRMQYAPTLPEKERFPRVGITYCLGQWRINPYFISPCLIGYQMGTRVGAQKHTPLAHLSSTLSPFAGRLVGRMQYTPTLSKKDKVSLGMCFLLSRTIRDKSVFLFSMFNRLSDRYPGRGVLNTPHNHSQKGYLIACQTIVRRMQYAPTPPEKKSDLKG